MSKKIKDQDGNVYVQKVPFYKKWWFILIVVLIAYGAISKPKNSTSSNDTTSSSTVEQTASASVEKASDNTAKATNTEDKQVVESKTVVEKKSSEQSLPKIGQLVKVGDVEYIVNSRSVSQNVGGDFGKTANGSFLILNVTVKNTGKKSITVTDDFFKLLKGDVEYGTDTTAGLYANEEANFFLSELNPENSITGNVVFDLSAETANAPGLVLQVQTGVWGTEKGKISLD